MILYCTDIASGVTRATGEKYTTATVNKMRSAVPLERLALSPQCGFASSAIGNDLIVR
jgi:hypothetical protein